MTYDPNDPDFFPDLRRDIDLVREELLDLKSFVVDFDKTHANYNRFAVTRLGKFYAELETLFDSLWPIEDLLFPEVSTARRKLTSANPEERARGGDDDVSHE